MPLPLEWTGFGVFPGLDPTPGPDVTMGNLPVACPDGATPAAYAAQCIQQCRDWSARPWWLAPILGQRDPAHYGRCLTACQDACTGPEVQPTPGIGAFDTCDGAWGTVRCTAGGVAEDIGRGVTRVGQAAAGLATPWVVFAIAAAVIVFSLRR